MFCPTPCADGFSTLCGVPVPLFVQHKQPHAAPGMKTRRSAPLSVITAFYKPSARLAVNAVECAVRQRKIPFIAQPGVERPPVAGGAPGPGKIDHFAADIFRGDISGTLRSHR